MSDTPRDQGSDPDRDRAGTDDDAAATEPTTGPPAGAVAASSAALSAPASPAPNRTSPGPGPGPGPGARTGTGTGTGSTPGTGTGTGTGSGRAPTTGATAGTGTGTQAPTSPSPTAGSTAGSFSSTWRTARGRSRAARLSPAGAETDARKRRRRRWLIGGIAAGASLLVIALCAGGLAVVSAIADVREDATDVREDRRVRDTACLELEQRLNRLTPPGATTSPQGRAVAVRDENAAVRVYVGQLRDSRTPDGWRQLIDARTAYAEGLDTQARSRTPAFFVAPRTGDGLAVAEELVDLSPEACAGPIRRLATPDL